MNVRWGDAGPPTVTLRYGPVRYRLYPPRERRRTRGPKPAKAKKQKEPEPRPDDGKKQGRAGWRELLALLRSSGRVLRTLCRHIVVRLRLDAAVGRDDAHQTALLYAGVCAALPLLLEILGELFTLKRPAVRVQPDFSGAGTHTAGEVRVRLRPVFALSAGVKLLLLYIRRPGKGRKPAHPTQTRKGGKQHEPTASHQ